MKSALRYALLLTLPLPFGTAGAGDVTVRVREVNGSPRICVDGKPVHARMFWGRSNGRRVPLSSEWTHRELKLTPHASVGAGRLVFRTEEKGDGLLEVRNLTVASGGTVRKPALNRIPGVMPALASQTLPFKAEETYTVAFDVCGKGLDWYRVGFEQCDAGVYRYAASEVPWDDGEETSLVTEARLALKSGCRFVSMFAPHCWTEGGDNWGAIDAQFRQLIALDPNILVIPRVRADAPDWWLRRHPECRMKMEDGVSAEFAAVSSRLYRREACAYIDRMVRHLMQAFPRNFAGIHISGQSTAEWFYWDSQRRLSGYDAETRDAFRVYLAAQGDSAAATAEVPTPAQRRALDRAERRFFDPVGEKRVLDFARFQQLEMADTVGELAASARKASEGRKLVVVFYGYTFEHAWNAVMPSATGHYGLWHFIKRWGVNVDAIAGPVSYVNRGAIGVSSTMGPCETVMRNGILWIDEDDIRVYPVDKRSEQRGFGFSGDPVKDEQVMTRTVGMECARSLGGWWMDLFGSGWYTAPDTWAVIAGLHGFAEKASSLPPLVPEIAAICDEESIVRLGGMKNGIAPVRGTVSRGRELLAQCGYSFGQYLLEDVLEKPTGAKLEFHLATWFPKDPQKLVAHVKSNPDTTYVWCGQPPEEIAALASGEAEMREGLAVHGNPGGKGYMIFNKNPPLTKEFVYKVGKLAGVHATLPKDRIGRAAVWPGNGFVTVQSYEKAAFVVDVAWTGSVYDGLTGRQLGEGPKVQLSFESGEVKVLCNESVRSGRIAKR